MIKSLRLMLFFMGCLLIVLGGVILFQGVNTPNPLSNTVGVIFTVIGAFANLVQLFFSLPLSTSQSPKVPPSARTERTSQTNSSPARWKGEATSWAKFFTNGPPYRTVGTAMDESKNGCAQYLLGTVVLFDLLGPSFPLSILLQSGWVLYGCILGLPFLTFTTFAIGDHLASRKRRHDDAWHSTPETTSDSILPFIGPSVIVVLAWAITGWLLGSQILPFADPWYVSPVLGSLGLLLTIFLGNILFLFIPYIIPYPLKS